MKATSSFKLSKSSKRVMATMLAPKCYDYKNAMIKAELAASIRSKPNKDRNAE